MFLDGIPTLNNEHDIGSRMPDQKKKKIYYVVKMDLLIYYVVTTAFICNV